MNVEEGLFREAGLAVVGVAVFIGFLITGSQLGAADGEPLGAIVMVGGIVAFIVVMGALGLLFLDGD